jgi:hypothetical protein
LPPPETARKIADALSVTKPAEIANLLWPFILAEKSGGDTMKPDKIIGLVLEIWKRDVAPKA